MTPMTMQDRITRDGDRWRYIFYLERELEARKTRQSFIRSSLGLNAALIALLVYQWWFA